MTTADTVRRLLLDAAGEALCECCLALACSVSLVEIREVTNQLIKTHTFEFRNRCASCRRAVPALAYLAKCAHCSRVVLPGEKAFEANGDILHTACFTRLCSDETIRISRKLSKESRRRIEESRRRLRSYDMPPDTAAG